MRIGISIKLRPFSHRPGTRCLIAYSTWEVQVFPAQLHFRNLASDQQHVVPLKVDGPVKGFTVLQDMEKGHIAVFGKGKKGYFRYLLTAGKIEFVKGEQILLPFIEKIEIPVEQKRLSLGVHKKQDWDLIQRRKELAEIYPFWLRLSQLIPQTALPKKAIGTMKLLEEGRLDLFFQAGFQGLLSPRLKDEHYLGLIPDVEIEEASPLGLIHEGARQIEAFFFREEKEAFHFLPSLPKELHAGRLTGITTSKGDRIDIEWSKKALKKVIVHPGSTRSIQLALQSKLHRFRLRTNLRQKAEGVSCNQPLHLSKGQTLYLDRFSH